MKVYYIEYIDYILFILSWHKKCNLYDLRI